MFLSLAEKARFRCRLEMSNLDSISNCATENEWRRTCSFSLGFVVSSSEELPV